MSSKPPIAPPFGTWRGIGITAYCLGVLAFIVASGIPFDRETVIAIIVGGLVVSSIGRPVRDIAQLLFDWLPFTAVLLAYDFSRGAAHNLDRPVAYTPQITAEKFFFFGKVPTVILQKHFYFHDPSWWDVIAAVIYLSHFIVPFVLAGLLWRRNWTAWRAYATRFVAISFSAVVFFALLPTAPPWAAAKEKHLLSLQLCRGVAFQCSGKTSSMRGLTNIGLEFASKLLDKSRGSFNPYAAIPSLHSGFALLVAITLWPMVPKPWRRLLLLYPALMLLTLVYTGEHYAVDGFVGFALVGGVCWIEARTRARRVAWWQRTHLKLWPKPAKYLRPSLSE